jgi:hypothetical protein
MNTSHSEPATVRRARARLCANPRLSVRRALARSAERAFGAALAAALLFGASSQAATGQGPADVRFGTRTFAVDKLPETIGEPARTAIDQWAAWAGERRFKMQLTEDQRVLLIHKRSSPGTELKWIERAVTAFDQALPAPPPGSEEAAPTTGESGGGIDDENWSLSWSTTFVPDSQTAVLLSVKDPKDYSALIDRIVILNAELENWAPLARGQAGCVLAEPLLAAWFEGAPDLEEFSIEAEIVNRVMQVMLLRRFGPQPYWLTAGLCWHFEEELRGSIYCFPYRAEFVSVNDHTGWDTALVNAFRDREELPLRMEELCTLRRGTFDMLHAQFAFGAARHLVKYESAKLPALLHALRRARDEHGRVEQDDGTWTISGEYELTPELQRQVFETHLDSGVWARFTESFRRKLDYKPKPK